MQRTGDERVFVLLAATSGSAPLGGLLISALPAATSVGRTVLTLQQMPIEVMASSTALLP